MNNSTIGEIKHLGNSAILSSQKLGFFCSNRCPGNVIMKAFDLAHVLRDAGITVISGFHTPVEKEVLRILLRGKQPIIICLARCIDNWRMPKEYKKPLDDERLLIVSPFAKKHKRITAETSRIRNELVASLADVIFIAYAVKGSKTEMLRRTVIEKGTSLLSFEGSENAKTPGPGAILNELSKLGWGLMQDWSKK